MASKQGVSQGRGESKTSPLRLRAAAKHRQALELRKGGATFDAIAEALGYSSRAAAYKAVMTGLEHTFTEPAKELRTLEAHRLDRLQMGLWQRAIGGDAEAIGAVLRIMARRAKLLGLDAPESVRLVVQDEVENLARQNGMTVDEVLKEAEYYAQQARFKGSL